MRARAGVLAGALAAVCLAAFALLAGPAAEARATPDRPRGLEVVGGEDEWHANREFIVQWSSPALAPRGDVVAARYELRDPKGRVGTPATRVALSTPLVFVSVPHSGGEYTLALRLEDAEGAVGPAATVRLRFDNARPPAVRPLAPDGWLGRADFPLTLPLARGEEPVPASGIAGYAVSVDRPPGSPPCESAEHCRTGGASTLRAAGEPLVLTSLPEGTSALRVQAVSGSGVPSTAAGEAELRVDTTYPVTRLSGLPSGWTSRPVRLTAVAADAGSGMSTGAGAYTAIRVGELPPEIARGSRATTTLVAEGVHRVAYYARDAAGNADDGAGRRAPRTATVRIDRTPPRARFAAPRPGDPELIVARVEDDLSGPGASRGWIGVRPRGARGRFEPLEPVSSPAGQVRARWDSDSYPVGDYEFGVTAFDSAGNRTRSARRGNGSRMLLTNPLKATTGLRLGFGGRVMTWHRCTRRRGRRRCTRQTIAALARRPAARTVPHGRGMRLSGRLISGTLGRVARAPVRILERFAPGAAVHSRSRIVWTDAAGRFRARLRPGPSRTISARFAGSRKLGRSRGRALRLDVRTGVRMGASSGVARIGGAPLRLRGRVDAEPREIPAEGLPVQLQFRLPGLPWSEFRTVHTDRRGRFEYDYSFSDDDSRGARFLFRAFVPKQSDWPYEPGGSRPVAVVGI